ncbi:WcaG Nucleoside-diphosphate-sugar epimerases [Candidatus Methylopumilus universalis]|uniref:SDR family oxidoreductase n=1 Tax=Candidatus Methylopumilus universalis TaxID=2588536 RepID=UPI003BEF2745
MNKYFKLKEELKKIPKTWLITGVAGFIGSNLLETLLSLNQRVVGIDNFSTGYKKNLQEVKNSVSYNQWTNFLFIEGDICDLEASKASMIWTSKSSNRIKNSKFIKVDYVLHQAAIGSVPRSIKDPIVTNKNNIDGFLNILVASNEAKIDKLVYAASSSTYGDNLELPKVENKIGKPLSPYALTKLVNEMYADVFHRVYGLNSIGLRYFNVFGPRQDPNGNYAAVIPKWIKAMIEGSVVNINGDGETSRDFCFIQNVVQANLLAAASSDRDALNQIYNVAVGERTSLNKLLNYIDNSLKNNLADLKKYNVVNRDFQLGDVKHSQADISKIEKLLSYEATSRIEDGIEKTVKWHLTQINKV